MTSPIPRRPDMPTRRLHERRSAPIPAEHVTRSGAPAFLEPLVGPVAAGAGRAADVAAEPLGLGDRRRDRVEILGHARGATRTTVRGWPGGGPRLPSRPRRAGAARPALPAGGHPPARLGAGGPGELAEDPPGVL